MTLDIILEQNIVGGNHTEIKNPDRREFIQKFLGGASLATLAATAISLGISEETIAQTGQKALLYDVNLSSFDAWKDKVADKKRVNEERQRILGLLNPQWRRFLKLDSSRFRHRFYLDVNTIAEHADKILADLRRKGLTGAYKNQESVYFNVNRPYEIFANVLVDTDIGTTVRQISTAFTPKKVQTTTSALVKEVYRGTYPKHGDFAQFSVGLLKFALRTGMKQGIDYFAYRLQPGQTFHNVISTYTQGDYGKNVDAVLKFNSIEPHEIGSLSSGIVILVPREIHKNPLEPTIVEEKSPGKYIVAHPPKPKDPTETAAEAAEREREKRENIPEIGLSANSYIDDVIAQNLMVVGQTKMPAVLTEAFNIRHRRQREFYSNDTNLRELARAYGRGILSYLQANPHVTKVIIDNGHGQGDPGAPDNDRNPTVYEEHFTRKIFETLGGFLRGEEQRLGMSFKVFDLDYDGGGKQLARLQWYVDEANRINNTVNGKDDSVYVSIHINSARPDFEPPPQVRVHGGGPQPKSTELGAHILSFAVPFYLNNFKS